MSLKARLKLCVLSLILLLFGLALFIAVLPFLVSTDAIRLRLARDLSSMTGYNVQLREPPHISVFPSFQAGLPHVILTDNSPAGAPLMDAEKIIVHMSLLDALRGRARFSETRLIRPHFTLGESFKASSLFAAFARSEGSFGNAVRETQNRLSETAGKPGEDNAAQAENAPLFLQPFGHIIIEDGLVTYPAAAPANAPMPGKAPIAPLYDEIRNIYAEIDWPQNSRAAALTANGLWHGAASNLAIKADNALLLMSGGASPLRVSFNSAKGGITFKGTAQAGKNFSARGTVAARSPGLDRTLSWLGLRPPFGANVTTPFNWESALKADSAHAELSDIVLTIGNDATGDSGRGALEIGYENGLPHIGGSLAFENLNISLPAAALFAADNSADSRNAQFIDMPVFNLFGLDLRVSSDKAIFNGIAVDNAAASIQIQKSGLIFDIGTMQIFDGTAQSSLRLKSDNDRITALEARFAAANTNLGKLQKAFASLGFAPPPALKIQSKADIGLAMQAVLPVKIPAARIRPKSKKREQAKKHRQEEPEAAMPAPSYYSVFVKDIWPHARGQFTINLNSGSLADFNMAAFMERVKTGKAFILADIYRPEKPAAFKFDRLEGKFALDNGALRPLSGFVTFGSHRLDLQGEADITANRLHIEGIFDPDKLSKAGQCADIQCLRQNLAAILQFTAAGAPFPPLSDHKIRTPPPDNAVHIMPKAGILP